jgi:hypothetical protein
VWLLVHLEFPEVGVGCVDFVIFGPEIGILVLNVSCSLKFRKSLFVKGEFFLEKW